MICLICLDDIEKSGVTNCIHHFCFKCLIDYIYSTQNAFCPKCRAPICSVDFDPEFDEQGRDTNYVDDSTCIQNGMELKGEAHKKVSTCMLYEDVSLIPKGKIGITLSKGVIGLHVMNVKPDSDSYKCGLRKGDAILSINNIPFKSHSQAIRCINNCSEHGSQLRFRIVRRPELRV